MREDSRRRDGNDPESRDRPDEYNPGSDDSTGNVLLTEFKVRAFYYRACGVLIADFQRTLVSNGTRVKRPSLAPPASEQNYSQFLASYVNMCRQKFQL